MIFPMTGLILGAVIGALRARARGGNRLDMLQWGAGFATALGLLGLFVLIFIERSYV